ncbi:MAG: GTPase HflX [Bdellovibrionaceae bacterium]|nr:GTPase HflX [Pseudobdellovibrionaceae bacterium]MBX3034556.1 GTPase HflX [Pseudobdellovibrionaceae bacterium]
MDLQKTRRKTVLVGIQLPRVPESEVQASLQELRRLVDTLGHEVIGTLTQKRSGTSGATVIGEGKLRELARWTGGPGEVQSSVKAKKSKAAERFAAAAAEEEPEEIEEEEDPLLPGPPEGVKAELVVFDGELTPSQMRNLESATGAEVLDRTGVIIEIFSRHARTRAARLQVEIARLNYLAPRLRETGGGGDRQGGGIGGKGAGETSQELDKRRIRDRIKELKTEIEAAQTESIVRRTRRTGENAVALVGYTNAGKSSLMRAMTGSEILVADKLFATLDTTVRPLHPPSMPRVLLSDTVGFIKKLPHDLVASFRSTLDEALNADLLLYVVDASDPTFRSQLEVTRQVLGEIGAGDAESRLVLNKRDRLSAEEAQALHREFPEAIFLSTRDPQDLARLRELLLEFFEGDMLEEELHVPYAVPGAVGEIRRHMRVLKESYNESGVTLSVRARAEDLARFKARFRI